MFYLLLCASFTIKSHDYGQDFHFYHKTKCNSVDKTLEQRFLKELKATCKNSVESELKQQKAIKFILGLNVIFLLFSGMVMCDEFETMENKI